MAAKREIYRRICHQGTIGTLGRYDTKLSCTSIVGLIGLRSVKLALLCSHAFNATPQTIHRRPAISVV
ncbi:hypothetical protein PVAG01_06039 [Phlyctema vagabunda]|uniref:Uncharacterized protein n=1 Tax=Phlyctema vagabunda TaxID=108571 RepID=A0ABR4PF15_9HELO